MSHVASMERQLIVANWFRKLIEFDLSIQDISKIIIELGDPYEQFDPEETNKYLKLDNDNLDVNLTSEHDEFVLVVVSSFGLTETSPGHKYHWKIQALDGMKGGNVGIIKANACSSYKYETNANWWGDTAGYAYYSVTGALYHNYQRTSSRPYADGFGTNDIIDVWLDLKDNYTLSFGKNGKSYGKAFDVNRDMTYKLAVGLYSGGLRLISFEIYQ